MPIRYAVDPTRKRVHTVADGAFDAGDIRRTVEGVVADPRVRPGFHILSDHRHVTRPITFQQIQELLDLLEEHAVALGATRWAIVSTRPSSYGPLRVLSAQADLSTSVRVRVFTDQADAEAWLAEAG